MSYTPGPWIFHDGGDREIEMPNHKQPSQMCDTQYYPWCPENPDDWRLMAAAPDLLEALKRLMAWSVSDGDNDLMKHADVYSQAAAVVFRAEGE